MQMQQVYSFSVKKADLDAVKLIERFKERSRQRGAATFSAYVIQGLELLEKELDNGSKHSR